MKPISEYIREKRQACLHSYLNSSGGFLLTELLGAILIMSLSGLIITGGISTGLKAYETATALTSMEELANEYEIALRSLAEDAAAIYVAQGIYAPVIESSRLGLAGFPDDRAGYLRFHVVAWEEDKPVETGEYVSLGIWRQHFTETGEEIQVSLDMNFEEGGPVEFQLGLRCHGTEAELTRDFTVWPIYELLR